MNVLDVANNRKTSSAGAEEAKTPRKASSSKSPEKPNKEPSSGNNNINDAWV